MDAKPAPDECNEDSNNEISDDPIRPTTTMIMRLSADSLPFLSSRMNSISTIHIITLLEAP